MIYFGIDPGKDGAFAIIDEEKNILCLEPFSEEGYIDILNQFDMSKSIGVLEHVHAMPGNGGTSMFNFGMNFGFIQGVLKSFEVPFELVTPQKWKKEYSVTSDKNTSISVAKRLFPGVDLRKTERCKTDHDGKAEALLMAEYARRKL